VPTVTTERGGGYSERGLLGLALSPTFATDHFVYAFYSRADYSTQVNESISSGHHHPTTSRARRCGHKAPTGFAGRAVCRRSSTSALPVRESSVPRTSRRRRSCRRLRHHPCRQPVRPDDRAWATGLRNVRAALDPAGNLCTERADRRHRHARTATTPRSWSNGASLPGPAQRVQPSVPGATCGPSEPEEQRDRRSCPPATGSMHRGRRPTRPLRVLQRACGCARAGITARPCPTRRMPLRCATGL
jgi:hypothetical protein